MARSSRWQQFSDNFNAVYATVNKTAEGIEIAQTMNDERFTSEGRGGAGLEGSALDAARYRALSDIQSKYGDIEGGLATRNNYESFRNASRENEIGDATKDEVIWQRGLGASGLLRGQTSQANAAANASNASAANSRSIANRRNSLLAGEITGQGLTNRGLELANARTAALTPLEEEAARLANIGAGLTNDGRVIANDQAGLNLDKTVAIFGYDVDAAEAAAKRAEADALKAQTEAHHDVTTVDGRIDATKAENQSTIHAAEDASAKRQDLQVLEGIFQDVLGQNFGSEAQTQAALEQAIRGAEGVNSQTRQAFLAKIQEDGLANLMHDAAMFTQTGMEQLREGGLDAVTAWYSEQNDDMDMDVARSKDGIVSISMQGPGQDPLVVFEGPEIEASAFVQNLLASPANAMASITAQRESAMNQEAHGASVGLDKARRVLVMEQAEAASLAASQDGLSAKERKTIHLNALAGLLRSDAFRMDSSPEQQMEAIRQMAVHMGMDHPIAAVPQDRWDRMPLEDKQLFVPKYGGN